MPNGCGIEVESPQPSEALAKTCNEKPEQNPIDS